MKMQQGKYSMVNMLIVQGKSMLDSNEVKRR